MKDFFKSFGFKVLAAIALVLVGVMIYAASTGGMATIPSMISGAILTPLQSAASAVSDGLNSFAGMFGSSTELQKQIDELQAELNDYRNKQVELDALREQNEWLKEYLNIIEQDNDYQVCRRPGHRHRPGGQIQQLHHQCWNPQRHQRQRSGHHAGRTGGRGV